MDAQEAECVRCGRVASTDDMSTGSGGAWFCAECVEERRSAFEAEVVDE